MAGQLRPTCGGSLGQIKTRSTTDEEPRTAGTGLFSHGLECGIFRQGAGTTAPDLRLRQDFSKRVRTAKGRAGSGHHLFLGEANSRCKLKFSLSDESLLVFLLRTRGA